MWWRTSGNVLVLSLFVRFCATSLSGMLQQPLLTQSHVAHKDATHGADIPVVTPKLEEYINQFLKRWHALGIAVAIIYGNETWAKGFGYSSLPSTPVTPHTLFFTGSTTKSFTAAGISLLVDNSSEYSSIQLTTPVSHLLRDEFVLSDEWATEHVTIEDALSHRTGYPRHDLAFSKTLKEAVRRLRYLPLSAEPRAKFQYNNQMYATAGYLIEKLTGKWLGDFFHKFLWSPMGMNETFLGLYDPALNSSGLHVADEYYYNNKTDEYVKQEHVDLSMGEGAGAVLSNVLDYVKYLRVMMAEAGPISKAGHRELKTPRSFYKLNSPPFTGPQTYSLGWVSGILENELVWSHGGAVGMFLTEMLMITSKEMGIVLMTNSQPPINLVLYHILYDLLRVDEEKRFDFEAEARENISKEKKALATCSERLFPDPPSPPLPFTVPLANHTGEYYDSGYGTFYVVLQCNEGVRAADPNANDEGGRCVLQVRAPTGVELPIVLHLEHITGNYWIGWAHLEELKDPDTPLACLRTQFRVNSRGIVSHMGIDLRFEGEDGPLVWFERVM